MSDDKFRVRDRRGGDRYFIDNALLRGGWGAKLGPYGIAVYNALALHADADDQDAWPSYNTIARLTGMSKRQAIREIEKLEQWNIISKGYRWRDSGAEHDSNEYILLNKDEWIKVPSDCESPPLVTVSHHPSDCESPKQDSSKQDSIVTNGATAVSEFEQLFGSSRNGHGSNGTPLLQQLKSNDPDQVALAQMVALGVVAKEHTPSAAGLEKIELAQWRIKDDRIREVIAVFLEATPLPVPTTKDERGLWLTGAKKHLEEFGLDPLATLYKTAWDEYLPAVMNGDVDITHPQALTKKMRAIRNRMSLSESKKQDSDGWWIDPDTGERFQ